MQRAYSYQEISLVPDFFSGYSRSECDTRVQFLGQEFRLPAIPANMRCTISKEWAKWLSDNGYFYVMHRFNDSFEKPQNYDNYEFIKYAHDNMKFTSISLGVTNIDKEFLLRVINEGFRVDFITLDIAHGESIQMQEMLQWVRAICPRAKVIAGNVVSADAVRRLVNWGVDAVKVGIAQGNACSTYGHTGFGMPMFTCVEEAAGCAGDLQVPIIADGGIRMNGDFAKAIRAGGTMVMAGSIFAACVDSPAENIYEFPPVMAWHEGKRVPIGQGAGRLVGKKYFGSASQFNKGGTHHIEGRMVELEANGLTLEQKIQEIREDLQSSISYAGGFNLRALRDARYRVINSV